eukprot:13130689-Alexandrium_andersonii.AAC.1
MDKNKWITALGALSAALSVSILFQQLSALLLRVLWLSQTPHPTLRARRRCCLWASRGWFPGEEAQGTPSSSLKR